MNSPCETAIRNLRIYSNKFSTSNSTTASSIEELLALHDAVYDKNYEMVFHGKHTNYEDYRESLLNRNNNNNPDIFHRCNFESSICDNTSFRYTYDFYEKGMPIKQNVYKMHQIVTINPKTGKIISKKVTKITKKNNRNGSNKTSTVHTNNEKETKKKTKRLLSSSKKMVTRILVFVLY